MPLIRCRTCTLAKQSIGIEPVTYENEKAVIRVRYCVVAVVVAIVSLIVAF